jgi:hypothetical protein
MSISAAFGAGLAAVAGFGAGAIFAGAAGAGLVAGVCAKAGAATNIDKAMATMTWVRRINTSRNVLSSFNARLRRGAGKAAKTPKTPLSR